MKTWHTFLPIPYIKLFIIELIVYFLNTRLEFFVKDDQSLYSTLLMAFPACQVNVQQHLYINGFQ